MSNSFMFYREVSPAAEVSHIVWSFWEFVVSDRLVEPIQHEIFPDGCVSIIYHRNENFNKGNVVLTHLNLESVKVSVRAGDLFWGARISPAAATKVLNINQPDSWDVDRQKLERISHLIEGLCEKLEVCRNFADAIGVYENRLRELDITVGRCIDQKIADAVNFIEDSKGDIKIAELSKTLNLSQRQLERRFKSSVGLTPKQFARARRIRAAAVSAVEKNKQSLAHQAAAMGFSDQSHLSHEVISVTGRSPKSFAEKVRQIEHGSILK